MTPSTLTCCSCRTAISVPTAARLLTCQGCGAQLEVVHGDGASYTLPTDTARTEPSRSPAPDAGSRPRSFWAAPPQWRRTYLILVAVILACSIGMGVLLGETQGATLIALGGVMMTSLLCGFFQIAGPLGRKYRQMRRRMEGVDGSARIDEVRS